jgi:trans-2,3-dihydro-3-hydroxyanthranilate isomerase
MKFTRRTLLRTIAASTAAAALPNHAAASPNPTAAARRFPYVPIDVFTSQRLAGNQLVVFTDARGLTDSDMLALARETTLQETTFVFPRDPATERRDGIKVRIFSPEGELPFAGHPTLGTAAVLRAQNPVGAPPSVSEGGSSSTPTSTPTLPSTIVLDLKAGKIPVTFRDAGAPPSTSEGGSSTAPFGEMTQLDPIFGKTHDRTQVAPLLGLHPDDLDPDLPIETVSTGLPFVIVPIRTLQALQSLRLDFDKNDAYLKTAGDNAVDFHYITRDTGDPTVRLRARNIDRIGEDPATGSASGCTAAWMLKYGVTKPDEQVLIRQGIEAHRPSELFVRASKTADQIHTVRVGGYSIKVMEGTLLL